MNACLARFRPDVAGFLAKLPRAIGRQRSCWVIYEECKRKLSWLCGWDAAPERYDQALYERAHKAMVDILGV